MTSPTAISTALAALKVQVPALRLMMALGEMNWLSLLKFWSLTASSPAYAPSPVEANASCAVTRPICVSSDQSPPNAADPVASSEAARSAAVACTNLPRNSAPSAPSATLQP